MTAVPLGETPSLCVLCPPQRARVARPGGMTDWACFERLGTNLGEMARRFALLSARPGNGSIDGGRRAPGYGSRPPVNLHAAALRDPRTAPSELGEAHSPLNFAISWGRWIRRERQQAPFAYPALDPVAVLDLEAEYLYNAMDWASRQPWITTFNEQLRVVVAQLRAATGEPNPKPVGTCKAEDCGHPLFRPREGEVNIRCGGCGVVYEPLDQIRMRTMATTDTCVLCGHEPAQHDNDSEVRQCNVRWCGCAGYKALGVEV